jgi:hypothetical protein
VRAAYHLSSMVAEKVKLRIGNVAKAVLVTGQAYQDPKDALNEFISNAADEYAEADRVGRIRVVLRRRGRAPVIAVDDDGRGMSPDRLRELARNLFESVKVGDNRTLGEKAIGLLAYQQLGGRLDVVSRADDSTETWVLRLERGKPLAHLERERRRTRDVAGTTVYIGDLDPDVARVLTQRKVVDYLRQRRSAALASGSYTLEVVEGRSSELVTAERPDGIKLEIPARTTLWGRVEFALYVAPPGARHRRVAVVARGGTTVIDDLAELEEFDCLPWTSDQVSGRVVFEALQQTAGRRAILRDRDVFPVFVEMIRSIEPAVAASVAKMAKDVDEATAGRLADTVRKIFGRVLRELADLDNPMRTALGSEVGEGGLFGGDGLDGALPAASTDAQTDFGHRDPPERWRSGEDIPDLTPELSAAPEQPDSGPSTPARPDRRRSSDLPTIVADPDPGEARSRFDADNGVVLYSEVHPDYLMFKDDEAALLDYLATLVAKEYVVYNNPRAQPEEFAEEMVRMLVRVRRHLPRRR